MNLSCAVILHAFASSFAPGYPADDYSGCVLDTDVDADVMNWCATLGSNAAIGRSDRQSSTEKPAIMRAPRTTALFALTTFEVFFAEPSGVEEKHAIA